MRHWARSQSAVIPSNEFRVRMYTSLAIYDFILRAICMDSNWPKKKLYTLTHIWIYSCKQFHFNLNSVGVSALVVVFHAYKYSLLCIIIIYIHIIGIEYYVKLMRNNTGNTDSSLFLSLSLLRTLLRDLRSPAEWQTKYMRTARQTIFILFFRYSNIRVDVSIHYIYSCASRLAFISFYLSSWISVAQSAVSRLGDVTTVGLPAAVE